MDLDGEPRVQLLQPPQRRFDPRLPHPVRRHQRLSIEVARPHVALVHQDQAADPRRRERRRRRAADPADPADEHRGRLQRLLSFFAEARHAELPFVDGPLFGG